MIDSYNTLPIGKFLDIVAVEKEEGDAITKQAQVVAVLADLPLDDVLTMPLPQYERLAQQASFLNTEPPKASGKRVARRYMVGGMALTPTLTAAKMNTAQYIDYQTYAKMEGEHIVELLSCLLVPEGHKYNEGYDVLEVRRAISEGLSFADACELSAFFLRRLYKSMRATLHYLVGVAVLKKKPRLKEITMEGLRSLRNGDGLPASSAWPI